jgi:S-DNA-T family DNA segregation ATPase FtsK/SpoIIIE
MPTAILPAALTGRVTSPPLPDGIVLPRPPASPSPRRFPVVATLAPVAGSVVLWAITRSSFALIFAILGPLAAVAGLVDSAWHGRRDMRRERLRFLAEIAVARNAIELFHLRERSEVAAAHPVARDILRSPPRDPERWRGRMDAPLPVVVGTATVSSSLADSLLGDPSARGERDPLHETLDTLRRQARELPDGRVLVDARSGIGICGPPAMVAACARGIMLQLANSLSPADVRLEIDGDPSWLERLPHRLVGARSSDRGVVSFVQGDARVVVAVADRREELPRDCRTVILIAANASATLHPPPAGLLGGRVAPDYVSLEEAQDAAEGLSAAAAASGVLASDAAIPSTVSLADIRQPRDDVAWRSSLACVPMVSAIGPVELDLVVDGPHALVGGTTGSGKSELLTAWVLAMAERYGPDEVTFLLVDFKGGAAFRGVQRLPHSVGLITDLDGNSAHRALISLRAELRYRERSLADAGVRAIEQLSQDHPLSRLVVVVDEFAAMTADFPELHELFADLASRGRSLGVHLVLCTQRPAGVIRDAVLANCTLRLSLRVNNRADSTAVVGTDEAAELPRQPAGRALVSLGGAPPLIGQVALASEEDVDRVLRSRPLPKTPPRRPWCDPLPTRLGAAELAPVAGAFALGLADLPEEQRQETATYDPHRDGSLLIIGGQGAGKSGALAMLARNAGVERVPDEIEGAWDRLTGCLDALRRHPDIPRGALPSLLLIDDVDALLGRYPEDYAYALVETIEQLLRGGGACGLRIVVTARRLSTGVQGIAALCDSRLLLRMPNRQEHVLAGGETAEFDPHLPPGAGSWRGHRVQLALVDEDARMADPTRATAGDRAAIAMPTSRSRPDWSSAPSWAVVAGRPTELIALLRRQAAESGHPPEPARPPEPGRAHRSAIPLDIVDLRDGLPPRPFEPLALGAVRVFVGDPATWQSQWELAAGLGTRLPALFTGCTVQEFRALSRLRQLPPPLRPNSESVWQLAADGTLGRVIPPWNLR